nr:MAG TPA: hypothetical protein [Caudoviricetes sp.]
MLLCNAMLDMTNVGVMARSVDFAMFAPWRAG